MPPAISVVIGSAYGMLKNTVVMLLRLLRMAIAAKCQRSEFNRRTNFAGSHRGIGGPQDRTVAKQVLDYYPSQGCYIETDKYPCSLNTSRPVE